ncbi:Zn-ribbon domain-containing OB-fold protein [Sphaerisporangium corydalis]|uniref:Zn-ribbon domain-containing OB-fold protein n=1 Tax=Sphaerisporangium corydalis TaxID=1441875 RepID=A0ABV9E9Z5_9ACTN|nr:OB-fold domain-containing protein [Sphaerisporangium corydalis]
MTVGPVQRDEATAAFFDGTARGEFLLRRCPDCGTFLSPQAEQCPEGGTDLEWVPASGLGRVVTWSVVHGRGVFPTVVAAVVELDEGPWWWTQVTGPGLPDDLAGLRVRVDFARYEDNEAVPVFRPMD